MTETRKLRVFLCHSSQDKPIVRELYQRLNAEGWIDPWLDEEKLLPGQDWNMEIEKAVEATDTVIVFLSNNSVTKEGYVQKELRLVLDISDEKPEGTIFVIPLRLDDCPIPRRLKKWQYLDYYPLDKRDLANSRLAASLEVRAGAIGIQYQVQKPEFDKSEIVELNKLKFDERNEELAKAVVLVVQTNRASTSLLQRELKVSYSTAARLLDQLEKLKVVGQPQRGSYDRDVLINVNEYEKYFPIIENLMHERLLSEAIDLVLREGQATISLIQRKMHLGYTRSAKIIDYLENIGIIGPQNGSSQAREVILK